MSGKRCSLCNGIGLIKTPYSECDVCDGKKCVKCNETGYVTGWWSECPRCIGHGKDTQESGAEFWDTMNKILGDFANLSMEIN